eukprot:14608737-Heterocapsa_arctica.AAC.1
MSLSVVPQQKHLRGIAQPYLRTLNAMSLPLIQRPQPTREQVVRFGSALTALGKRGNDRSSCLVVGLATIVSSPSNSKNLIHP